MTMPEVQGSNPWTDSILGQTKGEDCTWQYYDVANG